jgi:probable phosphoglycerate mutase
MENWKEHFIAAAQRSGLAPKVDRFYFLRHGETDHNRHNIVQGWVDAPLNALGEAQARQSALALTGLPITGMICSPLRRAHRTAELVGAQTGYPILRTEERIKERHHGGYEGKPAPDVVWKLFDKTTENYDVFAQRTAAGLNASLQEGVPLIVAHGGTRRILLYAFGIDVPNAAMGNAVPLEFTRTSSGWGARVLFLPSVTEAASEM